MGANTILLTDVECLLNELVCTDFGGCIDPTITFVEIEINDEEKLFYGQYATILLF